MAGWFRPPPPRRRRLRVRRAMTILVLAEVLVKELALEARRRL